MEKWHQQVEVIGIIEKICTAVLAAKEPNWRDTRILVECVQMLFQEICELDERYERASRVHTRLVEILLSKQREEPR